MKTTNVLRTVGRIFLGFILFLVGMIAGACIVMSDDCTEEESGDDDDD